MDLQEIKSSIVRQMIDNAYLSNWPRVEVADDVVNENTYDDLLTLRPGGMVRSRRLGGIQPMTIPYTADKSFPLIEYLDQTQEVRTGVARHNQGINPDDLNKTATGISLMQQAAAQRVELFARIFALGVEGLMRGVMGLVRRHQQQERIIRVTGGWLRIDPRQWREEMPVTVSVGLGTGNTDQLIGHLTQLITLQGTIVQQQGGVNGPLVYAQNVYDALRQLQESAGFKQSFFTDPSKPPPHAAARRAAARATAAAAQPCGDRGAGAGPGDADEGAGGVAGRAGEGAERCADPAAEGAARRAARAAGAAAPADARGAEGARTRWIWSGSRRSTTW